MSTPSPIVEVRDLHFSFGARPVLNGVSFAVDAGEYVSIIGPNGAGKTTLIKCMNRILGGARGEIRIAGRPLASYHQADLARRVGYVPQAEGRHFGFTVFEFVLMARYPHLSPFSAITAADEAAVRRALHLTGAEALADRIHGTLSGGERQKVFIAAALAQEGDILLLDEPTTFLDPHHQADIFRILHRVNRESGVTVLAVTHDINSAALASSRILALKDGAVTYWGAPAAVMCNDVLRRIYDKDFLFAPHPVTGVPMLVPEGAAS